MNKKTTKTIIGVAVALLAGALGISTTQKESDLVQQLTGLFDSKPQVSQVANVPEYDGMHQEIEINQNKPTFTKEELSLEKGTWESYSDIDRLNRVGQANAMLGKKMFPKEKRESLYIDPTGWKQKKLSDGQWLYNRSHLIGFQLTGQNNNIKNLMTGTRSLNTPHMLAHENDIAAYIKETNHHVRYRVTPHFEGEELVARGVQLEAQSIEDNQISFNVFIYNVQDGYTINYHTGQAKKT
ncbi:DNA/RNA non-specific endonuclease [Enterococcus mundtii]|uniref:DNA/RNA non-specific endonuclease n=1 Tax=Enterococcus TaxID=1350 RepID=UPI000F7CF338|nr:MULTISPECIES: DNA/RNA non-specific endonuclease [Enterococcus]AZP93359.1 DNA-entry nuclease [Enterococcus mundtii]MDA9429610.1 DNA-entry nuclease (Competence-specific nuclease) [Enterococcus mundtii 1A]MDK4210367.1 DNA/RNA non-specific endonuclease [Enterococcus mundtii]MDO7879207.1 DNA/RNA non-specific endonuclease [Enterococcus mundtii]MEC3940662.1 DNA/RNA non-specific endonuclease [Enterococcus mundtii]